MSKRRWSLKDQFKPDEDQKLLWLVKQFGTRDWGSLSKPMETSNSRQCRDRYNNYINRNLNFRNWTREEDALTPELVKSHGHHWSVISRSFGDRSGVTVRNRYFQIAKVIPQPTHVVDQGKYGHELYSALEDTFNSLPYNLFRDCYDSSSSSCCERRSCRGWTTQMLALFLIAANFTPTLELSLSPRHQSHSQPSSFIVVSDSQIPASHRNRTDQFLTLFTINRLPRPRK